MSDEHDRWADGDRPLGVDQLHALHQLHNSTTNSRAIAFKRCRWGRSTRPAVGLTPPRAPCTFRALEMVACPQHLDGQHRAQSVEPLVGPGFDPASPRAIFEMPEATSLLGVLPQFCRMDRVRTRSSSSDLVGLTLWKLGVLSFARSGEITAWRTFHDPQWPPTCGVGKWAGEWGGGVTLEVGSGRDNRKCPMLVDSDQAAVGRWASELGGGFVGDRW